MVLDLVVKPILGCNNRQHRLGLTQDSRMISNFVNLPILFVFRGLVVNTTTPLGGCRTRVYDIHCSYDVIPFNIY